MKGRVALVTGASRGIGAAIVELFRNRDVYVLAPTRSEMDLASPDSVQDYLANLQIPVDILVNNAGINFLAGMSELQEQEWSRMMRINLTAPLELARGLVPSMKNRKWGRILNMSSIFSMVTRERRLAYSSVKAGLNGLTRNLGVELAPYNVLVNSLCPGYVETELTYVNNTPQDLQMITRDIPVGRLARPEEIAKVAYFLCSDENSYLTGQSIVVDGGFILR